MSFKISYAVIAVIAIAAFGFLISRLWEKGVILDVKERQLQDIVLQDYNGREVKLSDFRGRLLIFVSWATWCRICMEELADLAAVKKEFEGKLEVVAINRAEVQETVRKNYSELDVSDSMLFLLDFTDSFYQFLGGFSMPETIFVDKDGFIKFHKRGPMGLEEIRRRIQNVFGL